MSYRYRDDDGDIWEPIRENYLKNGQTYWECAIADISHTLLDLDDLYGPLTLIEEDE